MSKSYWLSVSLSTARDKSAVASWFSPLSDGMTPYKAEVLCDVETDAEKKLRVFMRDGDGKCYCLERRRGAKTTTVTRKLVKP